MNEPPRPRVAQIAETTAAAALLLWRILALPPQDLYRDGIAILALYWIFTVFGIRSKAWPSVTGVTMIFLAAIYLQGQLSHTLISLGISP